METEYLYSDITSKIIKAYYTVYNRLGYGFLESVYHNAMIIELQKLNLECKKEEQIKVIYDGIIIGNFAAEIIVEDKVIIELKAVSNILAIHEVQLVNYLKATGIEVGLLLNFGHKPDHRRKTWINMK